MSWEMMRLFINTKDSIIFYQVLRLHPPEIHLLAQTVLEY